MDVLHQHPIRKTKRQKQAFRDAVCAYAETLGYNAAVERKCLSCQNVLFGDPENAKYLVTAHYDTCAKLPIPNLLTPCSLPGFLGYQLLIVVVMLLFALLLACLEGFLISLVCTIAGDSFFESLVIALVVFIPVLTPLNLIPVMILLIAGPANKNNANDNTSGVVTVLEIMRTMPENQRDKVCFVLFDQEEMGMIGSSFYRSRHRKASDRQMVLNLDCVGDGDHLVMFPMKKLRKDRKKLTSLYRACGYFGKKSLIVHEKGFSIYPSDQMLFPYGVGICALQKNKFGLYVGKIHTSKDTVLEETNVNILRAALTSYICCDAVNLERK